MTRAAWTGSRRRCWNVQRTQAAASSNKRAQWYDLFSVALIAPRYSAVARSEESATAQVPDCESASPRFVPAGRNSLSSTTRHCCTCVRIKQSAGCQGRREMSKARRLAFVLSAGRNECIASLSWFSVQNRNQSLGWIFLAPG